MSFKQMMESETYRIQKAIIQRETNSLETRNWNQAEIRLAEPGRIYQTDYSVFKKSDLEKGKLATLKAAWREQIRKQGYTKRNVPNGINGTI